jgi:rubrerythrin|tara:strand:+ start:40 stop:690 length:651 start_codon:yes stop_codon:yes gene_type:complete
LDDLVNNSYRLSYVEFSSGIEVLKTSYYFRGNKSLHKKIIIHALDEYRHSKTFREISKKSKENKKKSTPYMLIKDGGLEKSLLPGSKGDLDKICSYLYIGEIRAIKFNEEATKKTNNKNLKNILLEISNDEEGHAKGIWSYLKKRPKIKIFYLLTLIKLRFFFTNKAKLPILIRLQEKTLRWLSKTLFNKFPESVFKIKEQDLNLKSALKNSRELV